MTMNFLPRVFEWLNANPWLNLIFLILAIVSILATVVSHVLSSRRKMPCFDKRSIRLVEEKAAKMPRLRIFYDDERIENLTLTRVAIWNAGNDLVEPGDLAPADRLRLEVTSPAKLLGSDITYVSTPANNFRLISSETPETTRYVEFDYFHRREGIVVDVFHTGSDADMSVRGTFKGLGVPVRVRPNEDVLTQRFFNPLMRPLIKTLKKLPWPFDLGLFAVAIVPTLPFMMVLLVVDTVRRFIRPTPKEFSL